MRRVIGVYSGKLYSTDDYINGKVAECRLLVPDYVKDGEAYSYVSNHRILCKDCTGCPVKDMDRDKTYRYTIH